MKFLNFGSMPGKTVVVELTMEECDLIADGTQDGSSGDDYPIANASVSGALSKGFRALHTLLYLGAEG